MAAIADVILDESWLVVCHGNTCVLKTVVAHFRSRRLIMRKCSLVSSKLSVMILSEKQPHERQLSNFPFLTRIWNVLIYQVSSFLLLLHPVK